MVTIYNTPLSTTSEKALFGRSGGGGYKNYLIETKIATISPKRLCSKWYCRNI